MVATVIARPVMVSGNSDSNSPPASWRFARQPPSSLLSGGASFDPSPVAPQVPVLRPDLLQWDRRELLNIPVKNTFIEFPNHTPPFGGPAARVIRSCPPGAVDKENAAGNLPPTAELPFGEGMCGEGVCGSAGHPHDCKPCAWFHHARGCQRGDACEFCHLCPPGEIKRRKKDKYRLLREKRAGGQA